jgi:hypothetical protein
VTGGGTLSRRPLRLSGVAVNSAQLLSNGPKRLENGPFLSLLSFWLLQRLRPAAMDLR